jgi:glycerol uptake facilitator-like aquaporin
VRGVIEASAQTVDWPTLLDGSVGAVIGAVVAVVVAVYVVRATAKRTNDQAREEVSLAAAEAVTAALPF